MTLQGYLQAAKKQLEEIQFNLSLQEKPAAPEDVAWLLDYLTTRLEQTSDFITLAIEQLKRDSQ